MTWPVCAIKGLCIVGYSTRACLHHRGIKNYGKRERGWCSHSHSNKYQSACVKNLVLITGELELLNRSFILLSLSLFLVYPSIFANFSNDSRGAAARGRGGGSSSSAAKGEGERRRTRFAAHSTARLSSRRWSKRIKTRSKFIN